MDVPAELRAKGKRLWEKALADGTPDAADMIARALLAQDKAATERERALIREAISDFTLEHIAIAGKSAYDIADDILAAAIRQP